MKPTKTNNDILENAEQVRSWKKPDYTYFTLLMIGFFIGIVVTTIVVTPSIINACS